MLSFGECLLSLLGELKVINYDFQKGPIPSRDHLLARLHRQSGNVRIAEDLLGIRDETKHFVANKYWPGNDSHRNRDHPQQQKSGYGKICNTLFVEFYRDRRITKKILKTLLYTLPCYLNIVEITYTLHNSYNVSILHRRGLLRPKASSGPV
jgi:hypothetical protein